MFCLLLRMWCWNTLLLFYLDLSIPLFSEVFVLWTFAYRCLVHIYLYLELLYLVGLFPLLVCSNIFHLFWLIFSNICFVWCKNSYSCLLLISTYLAYLYSDLSFLVCVCLCLRGVFLKTIDFWNLPFDIIRQSLPFHQRVKYIYSYGYDWEVLTDSVVFIAFFPGWV
jgi:hypothetical protein